MCRVFSLSNVQMQLGKVVQKEAVQKTGHEEWRVQCTESAECFADVQSGAHCLSYRVSLED